MTTSPVTMSPVAPSKRRSRQTVRTTLKGRLLVEALADDAVHCPALLSRSLSGLVIGGAKDAAATVRSLRAAYNDLVLAIDPLNSEKYFATETAPFALGDGDTLFTPSVEEVLNDQIASGCSFGVTPTGYVQAGEPEALKAVINTANDLDRDDIVVLVPMDHRWLADANIKQLTAILSRSKHPVALALGDPSGNPAAHPNAQRNLRALATALSDLVLWRTDMSGVDAMAHGALAAAVGLVPSRRRAAVPDTGGRAANPADRTPQVFLPDLLRFARASFIQDEWYAATLPPPCLCKSCQGGAIDRFSSTSDDQRAGRLHNAAKLSELIEDAGANGGVDRWWPDKVNNAVSAHVTLSSVIGREITLPPDLELWASL